VLTFPAWWSATGGPSWRPEAALAGGAPWTFAGLTTGAWDLRDPLAPANLPTPGIAEAQVPLAWYDSASVVVGEGAAWRGFGAGLVSARGFMKPPDGGNPRAVFTAVSGGHALDRNGVLLTRGNPDNWLRLGAIAGGRGGLGILGTAGDHLWTVSGGRRVGAHAVDVGFVQRGMGERMTVGVAESGRGQAGTIGWTFVRRGDSLGVRFSRGFDTRALELAGLEPEPGDLMSARRNSNERTLEFAAHRQRGTRGYGLRVQRSVAAAVRWDQYAYAAAERIAWSTQTVWMAAEHSRPLGEGLLDVTLGVGRDATLPRAADRNVIAPAVTWHVDQERQRVRVFFERVADPVWSDLRPGLQPFLQHTWAGGFEAEAGRGSPARASVQLLAGRTANRATVFRSPVRALSLAVGMEPDAHRYNFLLLQQEFDARWRTLGLDGAGFALARGHSAAQPRVDPALGGQVGASSAFKLFAGDLPVRLRVQAAYVGVRESDTRVLSREGLSTDAVLPGYGTYSASATLALGDATIVIRGDALEGVRHPLPWFDYYEERIALDSGRAFRVEVVWPLFN
jgi:hypothetical protein